MTFLPDYRVIEAAARNERPERLPFYEHNIHPGPAEALVGGDWADLVTSHDADDIDEFWRNFCAFFPAVGYDTVSFEYCITVVLDGGALAGPGPGPIQDRADFERYPWAECPDRFWRMAEPHFDGMVRNLLPGTKALGGIGNGVFEIAQDLVGFERLAYLQVDDPGLFAEIFVRVGDLMAAIWDRFLARYGEHFCICRFGDDLGFKTGTLLAPQTIREHIVPQYERIIERVHAAGKPFLLHSCGCIFEVMDDLIAAGIDAKHSNEDAICDFDRWIEAYNDRIALFGGIDMDIIDRSTPEEVYRITKELAAELRAKTKGFAFGTGNQIGPKTPPENFGEMLRALRDLRAEETA
jgi:uroporphyrinogen decarboxylase